MGEIQIALIAIALVLSAVFLPMAFFGGSTGVIYRQFSLTIISAMVLSVLVALILSPALTATAAQAQRAHGGEPRRAGSTAAFPRGWTRIQRGARLVQPRLRAAGRSATANDRQQRDRPQVAVPRHLRAASCVLLVVLFLRPADRLPADRGPGRVRRSSSACRRARRRRRTLEVQREIENYFARAREEERRRRSSPSPAAAEAAARRARTPARASSTLRRGTSGRARKTPPTRSPQRASARFPRPARRAGLRARARRGARPRPVERLHACELQNTQRHEPRRSSPPRATSCWRLANADPKLTRRSASATCPTRRRSRSTSIQQRLSALGLNQTDVNATLSTAWGGRYVNDFIDKGRVKRVYVQGDAPYPRRPERPRPMVRAHATAARWRRSPSFATHRLGDHADAACSRFSGVPAFEFQGQAAPGVSSGEAMDEMEALAAQDPRHQRRLGRASPIEERLSSGQAPLLYALSLLVVFLCLAALYESWSIPVAVLLVIPLGLVGAVFAVTLRGLENDVYLQIGLLTTMGLAAKNAILMIEFAEQDEKKGARVIDAALEAARIRLRPILMTSFAFIFGVLPLAHRRPAPGANSRIAIGTSVIGGMLTATLLAIFYIPLFFVLVRRGASRDGLVAAVREPAARSRR